jgi:amidase
MFLTIYAANIALSVAHAQLLAGRAAGPDDIEPLSAAMMAQARNTNSIEFLGTMALLQQLCRRVVALWADWDVMLMPALAGRPPAIGAISGFGAEADPMDAFDRAVQFAPYAGLFNVTGQPAITIPAGLGPDGLPVAVQLVARPLHDDTLLQLARQLEVAQPWPSLGGADLGGQHGRDRERVDAE